MVELYHERLYKMLRKDTHYKNKGSKARQEIRCLRLNSLIRETITLIAMLQIVHPAETGCSAHYNQNGNESRNAP